MEVAPTNHVGHSGDAVHFQISFERRYVPSNSWSKEATLQSMEKIGAIKMKEGAQLWFNHRSSPKRQAKEVAFVLRVIDFPLRQRGFFPAGEPHIAREREFASDTGRTFRSTPGLSTLGQDTRPNAPTVCRLPCPCHRTNVVRNPAIVVFECGLPPVSK